FITIFVAAFPLAPLFALLNNWFEIRLDAHKLVCHTRRPAPDRANNIGVWFPILTFIAHIAVISNVSISHSIHIRLHTQNAIPLRNGSNRQDYDQSLTGYVNYTLATAPAHTMNNTCRYRDWRDGSGAHTPFYWKLQFVRFAFIVVFEHLVFSVCRLIDLLVPDIPVEVEHKIKRERYLARQALTDLTVTTDGVADEDPDVVDGNDDELLNVIDHDHT
ncbi:unnamed protein product, partial [Medioppia subpectinata]